jgi:hypothetical protein
MDMCVVMTVAIVMFKCVFYRRYLCNANKEFLV